MTDAASQCVLVVAPVGRDADAIAALLGEHSIATRICAGVREACARVADGAGTLVLAEEALEGEDLSCLASPLDAQAPWSELPVIVLTSGRRSLFAARLDRLHRAAGAITMLERPLSMLTLLRSVQVALRSRRRQYQVRDLLAAQRESELRYRTLVQATSTITWSCPPSGLQVEPQPEWMEYTGQTAAEMLGAGWLRAIHPEDADVAARAWSDADSKREPVQFEYRVRNRSGEWRWMQVHTVPLLDADGGIATWLGMNVDIHERKQAELQLRESERRFATMADGIPAMIWATDRDGELEFANRSYCEFHGLSPDGARHHGWQALVHPDDHAAFVEAFFAAVAAHAPHRARARMRHHSGAWRWVESHGLPRFDANGEFVGHVGLSPDVTDLVAAESALLLADRRKDQFLATLSHELRNPIAPIRTAAQLLATPQLSTDRVQWAQRVIQRQVAHVAGLLDDLLNVARITQGKLELRKERTTVASVVETAVEAAKPLIDRKQHQLVVALAPALPDLHADPLRLAEVLTNLLTNAAKYTDAGGRIELRAHAAAGEVVFEVEDTGIGIARDSLASVFEMFAQVRGSAARSEGGLGIGLALAKGLVDMHGGRIDVRSDGPGCGSTFTVCLPAEPMAKREEPMQSTEGATVGRRVLVVDDNRDAADTLAMVLRLDGHEVRVAYDGRSGAALAREFVPEVALLDIGLPDTNGYELARQLRAMLGTGPCLVALTGWGQDDDRRRAAAAGFDHHLVKPVDVERVEALIAAACPAHDRQQYADAPGISERAG